MPTSNRKSDQAAGIGPLASAFVQTVSTGPGVYQMLGKQEVLYVGKARNLRRRLAQYARSSDAIHSKTAVMLRYLRRVETILTATEKEALILEASLIKKHRPKYNVILRDDKNYPLIMVSTSEQWPQICVTRRRRKDGNKYYGPYASSSSMRATLKLLYALFPLRRCRTVRPRSRPCLNYQMGRCLAPCAGKVSQEDYLVNVYGALRILEGHTAEVIHELRQKMQSASEKLLFEQAALYRDQIQAIKKTLEYQSVVADHHIDQDVFGLYRKDAAVGLALLFVRGGVLTGAQTFFLPDPIGDDAALLAETILQYYSPQRVPPREVLLPAPIEDEPLVHERLLELRGSAVTLHVPQKGRRMPLMNMARRNAEHIFSEQEKKAKSWQTLAAALQKKLTLTNLPHTIECLDISNLLGKQAVGSLVRYVEGEKKTREFRHYRIKRQDTPDDYAMIQEVLERRFAPGKKTLSYPDMLLIDGGKGQLNVARAILTRYDLIDTIDLVSIAKEKQNEGEKLFKPGRKNPILLAPNAPALLYLMRIRDESHRFGITLHRKLRNANTLSSRLDNLTGIGAKRKKLLLKTFGSIQRLKQASVKELEEVPGIGPRMARSLFAELQEKPEGQQV